MRKRLNLCKAFILIPGLVILFIVRFVGRMSNLRCPASFRIANIYGLFLRLVSFLKLAHHFVRLVKQFYKIEGLDDSGLELLNQTRIETSEGPVSAEVIYDAATAKIDELGLRAIEFQLDGGSDVGLMLYVFDRL